ncbi:MAG: glutaredoxin family protein [Thermodesulfobacteriota bacterium]|nr:glutaredoxin family protein [Thermodesulfobacteriota bacterium]
MAKEFLEGKGVEYVDYNVIEDKDALAEMQKVSGGARSVPVITIGNEMMVGFDKDRVEQALQCLDHSSEVC